MLETLVSLTETLCNLVWNFCRKPESLRFYFLHFCPSMESPCFTLPYRLSALRFPRAGSVELGDSIHAQNAPPHRSEMRDESAKSKGKPPNRTALRSPGQNSESVEAEEETSRTVKSENEPAKHLPKKKSVCIQVGRKKETVKCERLSSQIQSTYSRILGGNKNSQQHDGGGRDSEHTDAECVDAAVALLLCSGYWRRKVECSTGGRGVQH
jgi:hypothetical protein